MKQGIGVHNKGIHHLYYMELLPELEVVLRSVQTKCTVELLLFAMVYELNAYGTPFTLHYQLPII